MPDSINLFKRNPEASKPYRALLWLVGLVGCVMLAGGSALSYFAFAPKAQSAPPAPADLFMQSVVVRDGALGWNQLCPNLQAQIPKTELIRQANSQHASDLKQHVTLSMERLGEHALAEGGEIHLYLVTAHKPDGWKLQRVYAVQTGGSGCVEDVQHLDPSAGDGN